MLSQIVSAFSELGGVFSARSFSGRKVDISYRTRWLRSGATDSFLASDDGGNVCAGRVACGHALCAGRVACGNPKGNGDEEDEFTRHQAEQLTSRYREVLGRLPEEGASVSTLLAASLRVNGGL